MPLAILVLMPVVLHAAEPAPAPALAIRNANVETLGSTGRLERATVVIRAGKIAAVGKEVAIPDDATVLDAEGGTLLPGLIDPYFEVSIAAPTADAGPRTMVVRGRTVNLPAMPGQRGSQFTRIADNFYPYDAGYKPLPRLGLTRLNLVTSGVGQAAVIRGTPADPESMLDRPDGLIFASVTNSTESLDQVRQRLDAANRARSSSSSRPSGPVPPVTQLWNDVFDGKSMLIADAANPAAVVHLLKAVEPYKNVKLALFMGGDSVAETVESLKGRNVRVILRPGLDLVPNTRDRFNPARMLHEAGVPFAFTLSGRPGAGGGAPAGEGEMSLAIDPDCPLFPVAMLVKTGLPRAAALEALVKHPAAILGLESSHGTIEPGKVADLILFSGDPLDPASRLKRTIVDGRTAYAN
jgi:hypothetical protein